MSREQIRLLALIVSTCLVVVGGVGGFLAWSIQHREDVDEIAQTPVAVAPSEIVTTAPGAPSTNPPPVASQSPGKEIDGYSKQAVATAKQKQIATAAASAAAQWSQSESKELRRQRLLSVMSPGAADAPTGWEVLYGSVKGATVTVESTGEPATSSHNGTTIGVGVMVHYKVRIPHDDGTEAVFSGTSLWVVEMPTAAAGGEQVTAVVWPSL
ncbi:hypothetical protein [Actinomyces weissii]|uniref:Uncharacterized protein n=1 Tax=Actinomyces weissii TaxID=675090 RepID=A0A7T7M9P0_9ACTO|nr:hypothetical protein [Actinomyces weissii]QQM67473.1 hypothetical protein JG540_00765 [Actinomyces weissii]